VGRLTEVLGDETRCADFKHFLEKEFAVEGLLFIKAIQVYKQEADEKISMELARLIFEEFVVTDSRLEVNLSSNCRSALSELFNAESFQPKKDVFDAAEREVILLLAHDPFRRFERKQPQVGADVKITSKGI
jgi:hypothetical protein